MSLFLGLLMSLTALFLIMLVLVQRGRGGGLAGALGGMGGSSAFGAKAGDVFTKVTIVTATVWILLCVASVKLLSEPDPAEITTTGPFSSGLSAPAGDAASEGEQPAGVGDEAPAATPGSPPADPSPDGGETP